MLNIRTHAYNHVDTCMIKCGHMRFFMRTHACWHQDTCLESCGHMVKIVWTSLLPFLFIVFTKILRRTSGLFTRSPKVACWILFLIYCNQSFPSFSGRSFGMLNNNSATGNTRWTTCSMSPLYSSPAAGCSRLYPSTALTSSSRRSRNKLSFGLTSLLNDLRTTLICMDTCMKSCGHMHEIVWTHVTELCGGMHETVWTHAWNRVDTCYRTLWRNG